MHCVYEYGRIEQGTIKVGEDVEILGLKEGPPTKTTILVWRCLRRYLFVVRLETMWVSSYVA